MDNTDRLATAVAELRMQIDWLVARARAEPEEFVAAKPVTAFSWQHLPAGRRAELWGELVAWVGWLVGQYGLDDRLPGCWYQHPAMVEEFTALYAAWRSAYIRRPGVEAGGGWDALSWHDALDRALRRLREWDRMGCARGTHHPELPPLHPPPLAAALAAGPPQDPTVLPDDPDCCTG